MEQVQNVSDKELSKEEVKDFFRNVLDKTVEGTAAQIYAVTAINYILNLPNVYEVMDAENKELARDIWLHIKQAGFQLKEPPMLFE